MPGLQSTLQHQHIVHHKEHQRNRGSLLEGQPRRDRHRLALIHQSVFRKGARAPSHHAIAGLESGDALTTGDHHTCGLHPDRLGGTWLVQAMIENELTAVQACRAHAQEQLAGAGNGLLRIAQRDRGRVVLDLHPVGLHVNFLSLFVAGTGALAN